MNIRMAAAAVMAFIDFLYQGQASLLSHQFKQRVDLGFLPIAVFLGRRRSDIEKIGQPDHLPQQLQELRLPVLEGVTPHLDRVSGKLRRLMMALRLVDKSVPAEYPVKYNRNSEKDQCNPGIGITAQHVGFL